MGSCEGDGDAQSVLRRVWGFEAFRGPQAAAVAAAVAGDDVLVVMCTGGGKSLCMQVPALARGGTGVIISPLISLMEDQVAALQARGVRACLLGSAQRDARVREDAWAGRYQVVYMTPELALASVQRLRALDVSLLGVDEAHCISEWGHDYRPEYLRVGELRDALPGVPVVAATATATPHVRAEIARLLRFRPGRSHTLCGSFERPNLALHVMRRPKALAPEVAARCRAATRGAGGGGAIVYTLTTREADELAEQLKKLGGLRAAAYHAKLPQQQRTSTHAAFLADALDVIVATVAYGMGIDKPNVRAVVHAGTPASLEAYFQQAGRAGRDGRPAECCLYWAPRDLVTLDFVRGSSGADMSDAKRTAVGQGTTAMQAYIHTTGCRAAALLSHLQGGGTLGSGGGAAASCGNCDNCARRSGQGQGQGQGSGQGQGQAQGQGRGSSRGQQGGGGEHDVGPEASLLLRAVSALDGRFGLGRAVALLRSQAALPAVLERRGADLGVRRQGTGRSDAWWRGLAGLLLAEGLLEYRSSGRGDRTFSAPCVTPRGRELLASALSLRLVLPPDMAPRPAPPRPAFPFAVRTAAQEGPPRAQGGLPRAQGGLPPAQPPPAPDWAALRQAVPAAVASACADSAVPGGLAQPEPGTEALAAMQLFEAQRLTARQVAERGGLKWCTVLCQLARCVAHGRMGAEGTARLWDEAFGAFEGAASGAIAAAALRCHGGASVAAALGAARVDLAASDDEAVMAAAATVEGHHLHLAAAMAQLLRRCANAVV